MPLYALGLGSSIGDRLGSLQLAVAYLGADPRLSVLRVSRVYETPALENRAHGRFLNAGIAADWSGSPSELLSLCKQCELRLGRVPGRRWSDRPIDVDLLWSNLGQIERPGLVLPHPQLSVRNFALWPLLDLFPGACDPSGEPYQERLTKMKAPAAIGVLAG